jgi:very-short-patch-repair endonuclease
MIKTIKLICTHCGISFIRDLKDYNYQIKCGQVNIFCSRKCSRDFKYSKVTIICANCGKEVIKPFKELKKTKSGRSFCNHSCSATYNNTHKTYGIRRSKLEKFLEDKLRETFLSLEILCNDKTVIGSELDFYFPTLKLGIEINGILHYEPIYGVDTLDKIHNNDNRKILACAEKGIELIVIPTIEKHMSKELKDMYWKKIKEIISSKLSNSICD